ncbi:MAG: hypothetical protein ABI852_08820 [Gemmatimonadaceae bacterium]
MNTFFLTCAVLGAVILVAQLVLGLMGGDHHDASHDANGHHAGELHDGAGDGLQLISVRALSAAVAFFGIGALGATSLHWPAVPAIIVGVALGTIAMFGVALTMRSMLKFEHDGSINVQRAVGESATVYIPVPAAMGGAGKVTLTLQGRTVEYEAVTSEGVSLPTGMAVIIVEVRDNDVVEVVPLPSIDGVP